MSKKRIFQLGMTTHRVHDKMNNATSEYHILLISVSFEIDLVFD